MDQYQKICVSITNSTGAKKIKSMGKGPSRTTSAEFPPSIASTRRVSDAGNCDQAVTFIVWLLWLLQSYDSTE
jgi:hypothetical protein